MNPRFFALLAAWMLSGGIAKALPCSSERKLTDTIDDVRIVQRTELAALVQVGYEKNICFGIEDPEPEMLTRQVQLDSGSSTIEALIRAILPPEHAYQLSVQDGLILIRRAEQARGGTWLDSPVPSFTTGRVTVQQASMNLFMTVALLVDPSIQGFAGSFNPGNVSHSIKPIDERGRSLRDLLTLIVSNSARGGAWISDECAQNDPSLTREPCWTILEYDSSADSAVTQALTFVKKAQAKKKERQQ